MPTKTWMTSISMFFFLVAAGCNENNTKKSYDTLTPPVETLKANANYKPAFAGQTRIAGIKTATPFKVEILEIYENFNKIEDRNEVAVAGMATLSTCLRTKGVYEVIVPNGFTGSPTPCQYFDIWSGLTINGQCIPNVKKICKPLAAQSCQTLVGRAGFCTGFISCSLFSGLPFFYQGTNIAFKNLGKIMMAVKFVFIGDTGKALYGLCDGHSGSLVRCSV